MHDQAPRDLISAGGAIQTRRSASIGVGNGSLAAWHLAYFVGMVVGLGALVGAG